MKIGILTFSKEDNFGANLQCFALTKFLQDLGHDVEIIDIQLSKRRNFKKWLSWLLFRKFIADLKFRMFWRNKRYSFTKRYKTPLELKKNPPICDIYIVGSDQVWNPDITQKLDPLVYFFSFLQGKEKRISYAASFGTDVWEHSEIKTAVCTLLQKFSAISVREKEGIDICKRTFNLPAEEVLDPTQIMLNYDEICGVFDNTKKSKYIMYFKQIHSQKVEKVVNDFAHQRSFTTIEFKRQKRSICDKSLLNPSVSDFLNCIRYANFVVTDSFHCLSFCLIYHIPFVVIYDFKGRSNRITTILSKIGLAHRICWSLEELVQRLPLLYDEYIDFDLVDEKLNQYRKKSRQFLLSALKS